MKSAGGAVILALLLSSCSSSPSDCDRDCLIRITDGYVAALAANDPSQVSISSDAMLVEDLERTAFGNGLWRTASGGASAFSIHVPDAHLQTAGWLGVMQRDGEPVLVAIRLKLEDGEIAEAEHLTTSIRPEMLAQFDRPRAGLVGEVPADARLPHDRLIAIGASYYDALDDNDGTLAPFAEDCERHENGMVAASPDGGISPGAKEGEPPVARDCIGQLSSQSMAYIDRIDNRRVFAADPVTGLVMGFSQFRHSMDFAPYEVTAIDGTRTTYDRDRFRFEPFDLPAAHVFKIGADGKIHEIEAMGFMAAYGSPTGWE